ncbi:MAG: ergothioneine biosynthesis protein EgtB [Bacteroidota bacterium]
MPSLAPNPVKHSLSILEKFQRVRRQSTRLCEPLKTEDYVVQPVTDVSPPKWHLAHTTWFFENFVLVPNDPSYRVFHKDYSFLFNSYYVAAGPRWMRSERGYLTRPTVSEVMEYRAHVDAAMEHFLGQHDLGPISKTVELGLQHEQQHQELLLYDLKYILGQNPLFPAYQDLPESNAVDMPLTEWLPVGQGVYDIGYQGEGFHFDNEEGEHQVFLHDLEISSHLVRVSDYLEFVSDGGYEQAKWWLSEGWDWVSREGIESPLYWVRQDGGWSYYTLGGLRPLDGSEPVAHVSFYEADAYARWKGLRLPTEFEWEVACRQYQPEVPEGAHFVEEGHYHPKTTGGTDFFGNLWEWTDSAYRPYPFYQPPAGAIGEYNGKFMINQMVLRGGSCATPRDHIRTTYRNFFHPHLQWLFSGFRVARHK